MVEKKFEITPNQTWVNDKQLVEHLSQGGSVVFEPEVHAESSG